MKFEHIYVFCPNDYVSGGPDALHQIVYYLKQIGCAAEIVYFTQTGNKDYSIPKPYQKYISSFLKEDEVEDSPKNAVIITETFVGLAKRFKQSTVFIWWLGVNNNVLHANFFWKAFFFISLPLRIVKNFEYYRVHFLEAIQKTLKKTPYSFKKEQRNVKHICASFHAYDYVSKRTKNEVAIGIEPLSKFFLELYNENKNKIPLIERNDVVLYNPKRCGYFVRYLSIFLPKIKFEPLTGLTQDEIVSKYMTSKLYVDFGAFPGAERIPKEAVLYGCAIITGKRGAAFFHGDVPIPDEYKFGNPYKQIHEIAEKIRFVLLNYEKVYSDFDEYRETILNLEENFKKSLGNIFLK